jgi:hypothetical protein
LADLKKGASLQGSAKQSQNYLRQVKTQHLVYRRFGIASQSLAMTGFGLFFLELNYK